MILRGQFCPPFGLCTCNPWQLGCPLAVVCAIQLSMCDTLNAPTLAKVQAGCKDYHARKIIALVLPRCWWRVEYYNTTRAGKIIARGGQTLRGLVFGFGGATWWRAWVYSLALACPLRAFARLCGLCLLVWCASASACLRLRACACCPCLRPSVRVCVRLRLRVRGLVCNPAPPLRVYYFAGALWQYLCPLPCYLWRVGLWVATCEDSPPRFVCGVCNIQL